jgi:hypothetical protein
VTMPQCYGHWKIDCARAGTKASLTAAQTDTTGAHTFRSLARLRE